MVFFFEVPCQGPYSELAGRRWSLIGSDVLGCKRSFAIDLGNFLLQDEARDFLKEVCEGLVTGVPFPVVAQAGWVWVSQRVLMLLSAQKGCFGKSSTLN